MRVLVVGFAVLAGFLFAASAYLQQRAAREVTNDSPPRLSATELVGLMRRLLGRRTWLFGWLTNLAGFFSQATALQLGSVVIVQPLLSTDLLFALPMSAKNQRRHPNRREWGFAFAICAGLAALIAALGKAPFNGRPDRGRLVLATLAAIVIVVVLATIGAGSDVKTGAHLSAVAAGVCFAMTAVFMKLTATSLIDHGVAATAVDWPGYLLALSTLTGLVLGQHAYASGPLPWAIAARGVTNPVVSFAVGALAFRVPLPETPLAVAGIIAGGSLIIVGITGLSHSATAKIFYDETSAPKKGAGPSRACDT